jgi:thiol:disulfide interchange protein/DsbC/DsbD-like thiol-disulfide interchange protein
MLKLMAGLVCLASLCAQGAAHTQARLLLADESARPGETVLAGVQLRMDPLWHTYWRNSGQSGLPTTIEWQLPHGVTAGEIQWPVPKKVPEKELTTYVYEDEIVLLVPLKLADDAPAGPQQLKAKVGWLECETKCVPGSAELQATLQIGGETKPSRDADLLAAAQKKLSLQGDEISARAWWENAPTGNVRPVILEWDSRVAASEVDFFPDSSEKFEVEPTTLQLAKGPGKVRLRAQVKKLGGDWPAQISGLLIQQSSGERLAYEVKLPVGSVGESAAAGSTSTSDSISGVAAPSLGGMLLYAFIGGLILNVMPCVLPVIALKILGFVAQAKDEPRQIRRLGLIYTVGVLVSFLALALIVIGLKAAGSKAGWGFQFGNPYFLVIMTTLVTLVALNLFGVFEVTLGSRTLTAATSLSSKHGGTGAFFNGLLATILATSCSAPFLGAAVGFAFAQPAVIICLVMMTVGLGLAAPYIVLSWHPAWLKFLPKPGAWMEKFKVAMGFPMMAAGVWLCSLLTAHYGERAWWMAIFLVFLAVAAWVYGEFVQRGRKRRWLGAFLAAVILIAGYSYALDSQLRWREPLKETAGAQPRKVAPRGLAWLNWSPEAVAAARAEGRPVVVDFTAKWCPTCNTVVKPSFENASVQKKLKELNAALFVADYTRFPDEISDELKRFQRSAVPLVLVYPRKADAPPMVFDWVTPGMIVKALEKAGS